VKSDRRKAEAKIEVEVMKTLEHVNRELQEKKDGGKG